MNTAIMKKALMALLVLAMATMMACDLAVPMDRGAFVDVSMGGTDGARDPGGINGDLNVKWVRINVTNSSGVQVGVGDLEWKDGAWKGKISVSQSGLHTFRATAGNEDGATDFFSVSWAGSTEFNVTGSGLSLLMPVSAGDGTRHIFYKNPTYAADGWRYMEVAPSDQDASIQWSNNTSWFTHTTAGIAIGLGQANTTGIVQQTGCNSGAAWLCDTLVLGGFSDWFLPSKNELVEMYRKNVAIDLEPNDLYWSSSEVYDEVAEGGVYKYAWVLYDDSGIGIPYEFLRANNSRVRAVREF